MKYFFLFFTLLLATVTASAQIIPVSRTPVWAGTVGVPGGIPNRTTIYKIETSSTSQATIQADLNSCPSNEVVYLSAGTYTWTTTITVPSYVTLRGAGPTSTIINVASVNYPINIAGTFSDDYGAPISTNHIPWLSNFSQNTNQLVIASTNILGSVSSVPVGNLIMIDQLSDTNCNAVGGYGTQGVWWSVGDPTVGSDRYRHEISYVTSKSGNTITIDPPIRYPYFNSGASPQVWYEVGTPVKFAGVEDLTVNNTGGNNSTHGIGLYYSYGCWVKNCNESAFRYGISTYFSVRNEIRHCTLANLSGIGDDYEFSLYYMAGTLVEDNIVTNFNNPFILESCIGNAFSYNYTVDGNSTPNGNMNTGDFDSHGGNNSMNLVEGNNLLQVSLDNGWGSAYGFVLLRNRIRGYDDTNATYGNYVAAIDDYSMNRFNSFVGNVLGTSGKNTVYEATGTSYNLVYLTQLSNGGVAPSPDPVVISSMVRAMNWDSATSTNGGLVTGGAYTASDITNSYLYDSAPTFFANLAWPPVSPTNAVYSSSVTNIPAGYRAVYGTDPTTNPPSSFSLTVNNGSGSGIYTNGQTVAVSASVPNGWQFISWTGDTSYLSNSTLASTTLLMPSNNVTITALSADTNSIPLTINNYALWNITSSPANTNVGPDSPLVLGTRFFSLNDGYVVGVRFYKFNLNTGTHIAGLWNTNGVLLAQNTFTNESPSGWQQILFTNPVAITSNTVYISTYTCPIGYYAEDDNYFATTSLTNYPLVAPQDGLYGPNEVYNYSSTNAYPTNSYASGCNWVTPVFEFSTNSTSTLISNFYPGIELHVSQEFHIP